LKFRSSALNLLVFISSLSKKYKSCMSSLVSLTALCQVRCTSANCKFSPYHDPNCKPPSCTKTCAQYRAYPEQHSMLTYFLVLQILKFPLARHIDSLCPDCEAAAAATSSGRRRR
ncbi:hypothetical protein L208DRAFT_1288899, partial [Tricholoma matsutake]